MHNISQWKQKKLKTNTPPIQIKIKTRQKTDKALWLENKYILQIRANGLQACITFRF